MAMDPGQRGFGQQQRYNIPDLPFKDLGRQGPAGAGNVPYFDRIKRLLPGGQIPPELLELLMAQFFGGQGGGAPQRPPMGGGRPPMGRPPMGGGRPPVVKIEDLVRALSGGGGQRPAPQANMPVPQARR